MQNSTAQELIRRYDMADLSLRNDAHCNACADEAHAQPGIARDELPIDIPFTENGEKEGEGICNWDCKGKFCIIINDWNLNR